MSDLNESKEVRDSRATAHFLAAVTGVLGAERMAQAIMLLLKEGT